MLICLGCFKIGLSCHGFWLNANGTGIKLSYKNKEEHSPTSVELRNWRGWDGYNVGRSASAVRYLPWQGWSWRLRPIPLGLIARTEVALGYHLPSGRVDSKWESGRNNLLFWGVRGAASVRSCLENLHFRYENKSNSVWLLSPWGIGITKDGFAI